MAVTDYSTTPGSNSSISGINIAENCPAGNVNGAIRQMMADIKAMYDALPSTANLVAKTGGVFTGNPIFTGKGGYIYNASSGSAGGQLTIQATGGAAPTMANGDLLGEY